MTGNSRSDPADRQKKSKGRSSPISIVNKVLIVGGGIGGMSLAICLRRRGVEVDLVDLDPNWRALGAGLTLNTYSLRAFDKVGVLGDMLKEGHIHEGLRTHTAEGVVVMDVPGREVGGDFSNTAIGGILRPALHRILSERTVEAGTRVRLGVTIDSLKQDADRVNTVTSDGERNHYDLVVGADGLVSKVRSLIMPDAPQPAFTGQGCWRAVFKRPPEVVTQWIYQSPGLKAGLNPISQDEMYMFILESVPPNTWRDPADWPQMLQERMSRFGGLVHDLGQNLVDSNLINYRPLEGLLVPPPWHIGRVQLIGDAVHATTPHVGYGAGLAVEDAVVLDEELANGGAVEAALTRFVERRWERCRIVVEGSAELGQLEQDHADMGAFMGVFMRIQHALAEQL